MLGANALTAVRNLSLHPEFSLGSGYNKYRWVPERIGAYTRLDSIWLHHNLGLLLTVFRPPSLQRPVSLNPRLECGDYEIRAQDSPSHRCFVDSSPRIENKATCCRNCTPNLTRPTYAGSRASIYNANGKQTKETEGVIDWDCFCPHAL